MNPAKKHKNIIIIDRNEQSQQNIDDLCEIEEPYKSKRKHYYANFKITNKEYKRINEQTVREALQLV